MPYADRSQAGYALASRLTRYAGRDDVVVLGLSRGGVPVAAPIAAQLQAPLDVLVVRKLGLPSQPELAMGAIAGVGGVVELVRNDVVLSRSQVSPAAFDEVYRRELDALRSRETAYRAGRAAVPVKGRAVIVVDDGLATGSTMRAAIALLRRQDPATIVVAVPVGATDSCRALAELADEVVCAWIPNPFCAVGQAYDDFSPTSDSEVRDVLERAHAAGGDDAGLDKQMRAIAVSRFGGPEVLEIHKLPERHAGPGEVRLQVRAATVNPTDTYIRSGALADRLAEVAPPPYVPGMDAAGVIDEVGEGVTELAVGDRVMAIVQPAGSHGAYASSVVLPARSVVRSPAGVSDAEASTLPMNGLTARLTLDLLALQPGQTLAVTGAAGCYGGFVVQLAKADGLRVVADASETDRDLVAELGADVVLPRGDGFAKAVRAEFPDGVDALADGSVQGEAVFGAVRDGGAVAVVRGWRGGPPAGLTVHDVWVRNYAQEREKLDRLRQQVDDGVLTLRVAQTYPAEQAAHAHRRLEAGGTRGRLVLEW